MLLAFGAVLMLKPSLAHAQCASGEVYDNSSWDGNGQSDIEQTVCIGLNPDFSYAEIENDSYATYQNLNTLEVYGVGEEAVLTDYYGNTLYDSGMVLDLPDGTGGSPVNIDVSGAAAGNTLSTSFIEYERRSKNRPHSAA